MEQRDYLKKQIDKLAQALGKMLEIVLGLKSEGKQAQATQYSWEALREEAGIDMDLLLNLPEESFIEALQQSGKLQMQHLELVEKILFEAVEGMGKTEEEELRKEKLLKRLVLLLEHLNSSGATFSFERHYKIDQIKKALGHG